MEGAIKRVAKKGKNGYRVRLTEIQKTGSQLAASFARLARVYDVNQINAKK